MRSQAFIISSLLASGSIACGPTLRKRATASTPWQYDQSYDWGELSPDYELCQIGTQQSPIPLRIDQGTSGEHTIDFNYAGNVSGQYYNWGYGPAFELAQDSGCTTGSQASGCTNLTGLPSFSFNESSTTRETVYLVSWHIHSPADHTVQEDRSKAELHLVHVNAAGKERAVLAIRIDPGLSSHSDFFAQVPFPSSAKSASNTTAGTFPSYNDTGVTIASNAMDLSLALQEVSHFNEFWTYKGSLTSPPCTEGIRFFVARQILFTSNEQMQDILRVSRFSARQEQEVWMHGINV